ncbi:MAG: ABC transporter permease [Thermoplasmatales archaeon]|nr:MAG: ABC transporter permease [Thermoplasmatales archaeon]
MKLNPVLNIVKKEIMDNIRNKWIIVLSIIFALLTLVVSYFGSIFSEGWQDLGVTISGMMNLVQFLVPIIALILGYAAIIGEIERGSMSALLSLPVSRLEIVLGKFIGLGSILGITILVGFGIAGIIIALNVADTNFLDYLVFIASTILIGLVFLSLAIFFSTLFKKRTTAMGGAIFLWFLFNMILPIVYTGILATAVGLSGLLEGEIPEWYHLLTLTNPLSVYGNLNSLALNLSFGEQITISYPSFFSGELMAGLLILWIVIFLLLSIWRFNKKDI